MSDGEMSGPEDLTWTASAADYEQALRGHLTQGELWRAADGSRLQRLLRVLSGEAARHHNADNRLVEEADPRTALDLLRAWERDVGEPDECAGGAETIEERRARVVQKLTARGGQSRAFMVELARSLGYEIEITEYRPFVAGLSRCGGPDRLNGGHGVRFFWSVSVSGPRLTYFRTGSSAAGEKLLTIARAEDLECVLQRAAPAHTRLIYTYLGV